MLPEVGVPELLVIAAIALIVVGPKDLPILMRKLGRFLAHMRGMAAEFRASFDEMARQSELDELRREVEAMRAAAQQPMSTALKSVGLGDVKTELESHFVVDPHETPQPHVGPLGEPFAIEPAAAGSASAEPPAVPKPKATRKAKAKTEPEAQPDQAPTPEAGS